MLHLHDWRGLAGWQGRRGTLAGQGRRRARPGPGLAWARQACRRCRRCRRRRQGTSVPHCQGRCGRARPSSARAARWPPGTPPWVDARRSSTQERRHAPEKSEQQRQAGRHQLAHAASRTLWQRYASSGAPPTAVIAGRGATVRCHNASCTVLSLCCAIARATATPRNGTAGSASMSLWGRRDTAAAQRPLSTACPRATRERSSSVALQCSTMRPLRVLVPAAIVQSAAAADAATAAAAAAAHHTHMCRFHQVLVKSGPLCTCESFARPRRVASDRVTSPLPWPAYGDPTCHTLKGGKRP